jgi:hypothetical protein
MSQLQLTFVEWKNKMVVKIPGLEIGDGGVYFLSASKGAAKSQSKHYKIGMSKRNLLDRINSYGVCFTRINLAAVIVVKRQTKQQQPNIALNLERFIHAVLDSWGKFKKYAVVGEMEGGEIHYVSRRVGEFYEMTADEIHLMIKAIWDGWLVPRGAVKVLLTPSSVEYDPNEGTVVQIDAPKRQDVLAKPPGPIMAKPQTVKKAVLVLDAAGKRRPFRKQPPRNPKEAPYRLRRSTKRRRIKPKRFREE